MKNFSKIAYLGRLGRFSKSELEASLPGYQVIVLRTSLSEEIIRFSGESIQIDIAYELNGKFKRIVGERWEKPLMVNVRL